MNPKIRRLFNFYIISASCCTLLFGAGILIKEYSASLLNAYDTLQTLRTKQVIMKNVIREIDEAIVKINKEIPRNYSEEMTRAEVLYVLDDIKRRFTSYDVSITGIEKKDLDIALPVNIVGPVFDYKKFINDVSYLQNISYPFFLFKDILVEKREKDGKSLVVFDIKGEITMRIANPGVTSGS
jgi:hypothetical protein